ncbi:helix-turn-helix domain-containing protein [Desulfotomaculum copahuensis]|uniref:HTH cro/C1-type domain-containing protein n=1 Tax=Desulfotomaculum copahuensis TaxID=1838280 RepID=A0A1B7LG70_9FIRM|nr:helix-turn-helix transcriptional regulator [Desulfotomaculum copahuensis]OAT83723.1 hypothetical protein A6M21_07755 [Desulfotomaculum copahuensis]
MCHVNLEKIRELRRSLKISQKTMAKNLGYKTEVGYLYLEKGRCRIRADQLVIIAETLGVKVAELLTAKRDDAYAEDPNLR